MNRKQSSKQRQNEIREGNERGLYILHTGHGKGKTSAAMNMVYRHLAHDLPVAVVQFVKATDEFPDGDRRMLLRLKELGMPVQVFTLGTGFSWNSTDPESDKRAAEHAFATACNFLRDGSTRLVLLDEIHIAINLGYLDADATLEGLSTRHPMTHVITTGRYAPESLIEAADLVTEMKLHKHHI
ncbi:MAG: cob(I)yrinic acid a,c-diamide adenosyltransferase, partial [Opitutales bacterium]|nr:cob(I)yrinic acid a,c-diamide adenosyltransferase [Opitutales bacterium]